MRGGRRRNASLAHGLQLLGIIKLYCFDLYYAEEVLYPFVNLDDVNE